MQASSGRWLKVVPFTDDNEIFINSGSGVGLPQPFLGIDGGLNYSEVITNEWEADSELCGAMGKGCFDDFITGCWRLGFFISWFLIRRSFSEKTSGVNNTLGFF
ncbi:hypothetical protein Zmor_012312 [Zophobas morio]|uniref:Uncharacterized protein n=1 Tax=Zophobas morio TaxID=2755281 RepID=A0AA38HF61_9CUCU|nr:hypothetical protein Zmor_012312 [Zophobas morio]